MQPLDKAIMGPLKTFYCWKTDKLFRSNLGRGITVYQIGEQFSNTYKRGATAEIASDGFWATDLFPCDKIIFRPHDFPLASEDTDDAPVIYLALVKTSNQPSFSSVNFSLFISAEALPASGISPVPSLNLQLNTCGGTANKIKSSPYKKFVEATQKKKIKQATKSKTNQLASNAFLGPSKRQKRRFSGIQLRLTLIRFEHWPSCSFRWQFNWRRRTRRWLCVLYRSFLWKPQWIRVDTMCEIFQMGAHTVLVWRKFLFVRLFRDKYCFVLSLYLLYLQFFQFCNYFLWFLCKLFNSPN